MQVSTITHQTMNSLEIAKLTGKDHGDVLKDIRRILEEAGIDGGKFSGIYKDASNRDKPCFNLPRRECDLVIAGYSVKYRLAIIDRWQELESKQSAPALDNPKVLREMLLSYTEKVIALEQKVANDAPKVEFAEAVRRMQGACHIGDFAKTIAIGRNTFFKMLRADGILMANNLPYQKYIDDERFVVIEQVPYTNSKGITVPAFTPMLTGKGQVWLEKKYRAYIQAWKVA